MTSDPQPSQGTTPMQRFMAGRTPLIILGVLIVVSLIAICVLGFLLLRASNDSTADTDIGPTPFPDGSGPGLPASDALVVGISDSTTITVPLDAPVMLNMGGRSFPIEAQTINPNGTWSPGLDDSESAGWVYGSIVNYIMGLRASNQNQELLESLLPGDTIVLQTESGATQSFEFASRELVAVNDQNVFSQHTPGLTVLLLQAGGNERLAISGRYVVAETLSTANDATIELGESAQLADLQIAVVGATYVPDRAETPPGFAFFLIDFQIDNQGAESIDLSQLQLILIDEFGNQYALNPVATQLGENQPLSGGALSPGQSVIATAGYQIPAGLVSASLRWIVTRTDAGTQVQVNIPFTDANAAQNATVVLQSVTVAEDLTTLTLSGQITNNGGQPLIVADSDVSLRTNDGAAYALLSVNPPFPWTVPSGQSAPFAVTFQRPANADSAVFTLLNQPFQLNNLR